MSEHLVICVEKGHTATITLNRPGTKNIIDSQLAQEMAETCARVNQDDDIYVVLLTGLGDAFCAGGEDAGAAAAVAGIEKPVLAVINGEALAVGLELALACDIRLASEGATFGLPQIASARIPAGGGTQRLPRIVGKGKALELILTGETIDAREAFNIGLVSKVVPHDKLLEEANALAEKMASQAPVSLRFVKEAVNKGLDLTLDQGLRLEMDLYMLLHTTSDRTEGIKAFLEKRKPEFKGK